MRSSVIRIGVVCGWIALGTFAAQGQTSSSPHLNPEAAKIKNPTEATADSVASGKKLFMFFCAACHGPGAKGDGGIYGAFGGGSPTNLTEDAWQRAMSDGEIFTVIRDGIQLVEMAGFKKRMTDPQIWDVVNFVRSVAEHPAAKK